jgi:hypothetical protein
LKSNLIRATIQRPQPHLLERQVQLSRDDLKRILESLLLANPNVPEDNFVGIKEVIALRGKSFNLTPCLINDLTIAEKIKAKCLELRDIVQITF